MAKQANYHGKNVLVLGLAKSGYYAAKLLLDLGATVTVNDAANLAQNKDAQELEDLGVVVISGSHPENLLNAGFDLIVKNPGIPYTNPVLEEAKKRSLPIVTEIEVATTVTEASIIGITGTNGKTTTTSIIYEMLSIGRDIGSAYAIGNIGVPASKVALALHSEDDAVIELSSFQLMGTPNIRPEIAVITNLFSAHLDYHGSQDAYEEAKMNLLVNQTAKDYVIYNADQAHLVERVESLSKAQKFPFSRSTFLEQGICAIDGKIYFNGEAVANVSDIFLSGLHNLENFLAAIGVAKLKGISNETIQQVLRQFQGVKHRTQYVREFSGRIFYNDSKATNIEATENALNGFNKPVILLAGGLDRGNTFDELVPALKNVKALITFGENFEKMVDAAEKAGIPTIIKTEDIRSAVPEAYKISAPGDVILLSPAAASWDQYANFEIRGDTYIEAIEQLVDKENQ